MAELGEHAERHHARSRRSPAELGVEVIAVGELARAYGFDDWAPDADAALEAARAARPAGDAVLVKASRSVALEGIAPALANDDRVMVRVFIAGLIAMVVSVVIGPKFIAFLRRNELGQPIREDGPAGHVVKQGTPVMGGLLILLCASLPFLALSRYTLPALTVLFLTVSCAAIGFLDDFIKVRHRRSLGLQGRWKLLLLAAITVVVGFAVTQQDQLDTSIYVPVVDVDIPLSLRLLPVPLPRDRGRGERREPHGRARRARSRDRDHRPAHVPLDQRDRLHPLRRRRRSAPTSSSTSRSSPPR